MGGKVAESHVDSVYFHMFERHTAPRSECVLLTYMTTLTCALVLVLERLVLMCRIKATYVQRSFRRGATLETEKRKTFSVFLTIVLFVIFSIPMVCIQVLPIWLDEVDNGTLDGATCSFAIFVLLLNIISPWVLFVMATVSYHRRLRTRAYIATLLFFWAALTQIYFLVMRFIDSYPRYLHY